VTVTALLVIVGAVVVFLAGWSWGRLGRPLETEQRSLPELTDGPTVDEVLTGHPTGVVVADRTGRVQYRNLAAMQFDGTHAGVLLDEAIEHHLRAARDGVDSAEIAEFYGPPKMVFDVTGRPLLNGGSAAFVDDISERRRIDHVRTDFVANISHELKTPIGALSVLAETLVDADDPATIRRVVARMLAEADRATHTIDDLIELSRIETGGEQTVEPVRVFDVVRGALDRVTELAARREISVSALDAVDGAAQRSESLLVSGDRRQLVSAVGNLVENAVKYSDPGSSVQVRSRSADDWVEIAVTDQGVGIPQRDLDRIFERFYRVDRARSRTTGGTGLGLSIVRHVASNHGGDVIVTSTEGEGSTFVLRLPLRRTGGRGGDQHPDRTDTVTPRQPHDPTRDQGVA